MKPLGSPWNWKLNEMNPFLLNLKVFKANQRNIFE